MTKLFDQKIKHTTLGSICNHLALCISSTKMIKKIFTLVSIIACLLPVAHGGFWPTVFARRVVTPSLLLVTLLPALRSAL
jgi:hypothetical protein